ncbi:putative secondary metabolism biosynthetic enzyme [Pyricularia oryzae]|nr:putative secondary metabolism biosynthetic enzyme [Pyricularia oryzae]KAI6496220.1 putative secondary metabolism biosynthetic enzyme [Pyricularia oryzae]
MPPTNNAALLSRARAHPLRVEAVDYPTAGAGELIVKAAAVALNPVDWFTQALGDELFDWLQYPFVPGFDVAGTVVQADPGIASFSPGDRVLGLRAGFTAREGAFQEYVAVPASLAARIPDALPFIDAAVLPVGFGTAAALLYESGGLGLALPEVGDGSRSRDDKKTVIVWAGASSVGANAIQLAVASGYEVFTTSSPRNFGLCRSLGAAEVFDYKSPGLVAEMAAALEGKTVAGAAAIHQGSLGPVFELLSRSEIQGSKKVASANPLGDVAPPAGVTASFILVNSIKDSHIGAAVFNEFLPTALATGSFQAKPAPLVVGRGLESLQEAMDRGREGNVSAQKLVVSLE